MYSLFCKGLAVSNLTKESKSSANSASQLTRKDRNTLAKMTYGNRGLRGRGIKLLHWNKGSSYLQNKYHEVETIIDGHKPHVLGLSEANLKSSQDLNSKVRMTGDNSKVSEIQPLPR